MEYSLVEKINYLSFNLVKDSIPEVLYHYSTAKIFIETLQTKEYYISHYKNFSDKEEVIFGIDKVYEVIIKYSYFPGMNLELLIDELKANVMNGINLYCLSFTNESNSESHWKIYGGNNTGVVYGISNIMLTKILRNYSFAFSFLLPVNYFSKNTNSHDSSCNTIRCLDFYNTLKESILLIHEEYINVINKQQVTDFLKSFILAYASNIKCSEGYLYEKEYRLIINTQNMKNVRKIGNKTFLVYPIDNINELNLDINFGNSIIPEHKSEIIRLLKEEKT